jgi:hypothetical protein
MAPQTIDEVLAELDQIIHRARNERDRLGFFATLYRNVTINARDPDSRKQRHPAHHRRAESDVGGKRVLRVPHSSSAKAIQ